MKSPSKRRINQLAAWCVVLLVATTGIFVWERNNLPLPGDTPFGLLWPEPFRKYGHRVDEWRFEHLNARTERRNAAILKKVKLPNTVWNVFNGDGNDSTSIVFGDRGDLEVRGAELFPGIPNDEIKKYERTDFDRLRWETEKIKIKSIITLAQENGNLLYFLSLDEGSEISEFELEKAN